MKGVIGDVEVDRCVKCSSIWFDLGKLEKTLEHEGIEELRNEVDNNAGHDEKRGKCLRCSGAGDMVRVRNLKHAHIHVDTCPVCYGQWLDGGRSSTSRTRAFSTESRAS